MPVSRLFEEAQSAPDRIAAQWQNNAPAIERLVADMRQLSPQWIVTCARGSSDHAASFAKYLIETELGLSVASHALSVSSLYHQSMPALRGQVFLCISQSGRSADILESAERAKASGAFLLCLVNDETSPLAQMADAFLPLGAGPETSVAASKSFLCSLACLLQLVSAYKGDRDWSESLKALPAHLRAAWQCDPEPAVRAFTLVQFGFTLGRGPTHGIAQEAALKFKETCALPFEAFSMAEFAHGPRALARQASAFLLFPPYGPARPSFEAGARELQALGATMWSMAPLAGLPCLLDGLPGITGSSRDIQGSHWQIPLVQAIAFYRFIDALAFARGLDPDQPPYLSKVTTTL